MAQCGTSLKFYQFQETAMMRPLIRGKKWVLKMLAIRNDGIMQSTLEGKGRKVLKKEEVTPII